MSALAGQGPELRYEAEELCVCHKPALLNKPTTAAPPFVRWWIQASASSRPMPVIAQHAWMCQSWFRMLCSDSAVLSSSTVIASFRSCMWHVVRCDISEHSAIGCTSGAKSQACSGKAAGNKSGCSSRQKSMPSMNWAHNSAKACVRNTIVQGRSLEAASPRTTPPCKHHALILLLSSTQQPTMRMSFQPSSGKGGPIPPCPLAVPRTGCARHRHQHQLTSLPTRYLC